MKYKKFPKFVHTLIVSHVLFYNNTEKFGVIIKKIDNLIYVISYDYHSISECLVFNGDELYDSYILEESIHEYKGKLIKDYVNI